MSRSRHTLLLLLLLALGLPVAPAWAQDDLDDLDDLEDLEDEDAEDTPEEEVDEEVDSPEIYDEYKSDLRGESAAEELDAWSRYLEVYSKSQYRMEIEKRMKGLEEAAFRELSEGEDLDADPDSAVDAKDQEMFMVEPALIHMGVNTRRHVKLQALWGFNDLLNYELAFEWAFVRKFSAFGAIRHQGRGLGAQLQVGAKYALVKDVSTGVIVTGAFSVAAGYNAFDRLSFAIEPYVGFGWIASDKFQIQTSIVPYVRLDRPRLTLLWDLMVVVSPTPVLSIYVESKQKHSFVNTENSGTKYFGFQQAGVGVKIFPQKTFELSVGVNVPYAWDRWKDYKYFGVHAGLTVYFDKKKKKD